MMLPWLAKQGWTNFNAVLRAKSSLLETAATFASWGLDGQSSYIVEEGVEAKRNIALSVQGVFLPLLRGAALYGVVRAAAHPCRSKCLYYFSVFGCC